MARKKSAAAETGFAALGLDERIIAALTELGYEEPTPIQTEAIPPLLEGRDLVGQAATGTGKTAAFSLPLIARLGGAGRAEGARRRPSALVLVPTRELAMQVAEAIHRYGRSLGVDVLPIYGGQSFTQQLRVLKRGVDVVVATPGRALDHINRETLRLEGVETLVLDEADEMLDMGFAEDLEAILAATPEERQTVLFSATMPARIAAIAKRHLRDPVQIRIAREAVAAGEAPRVRQTAYVVPRAHKQAALARVLDLESPEAALVFCRTRTEVDELTETMIAHGYLAEALHGGMNQEQRDRVMRKLRGGSAELLIATDVAARGLDVARLTHVINYDVPNAPESYVHRIGRVGRAGREGVAITLAEPREHRLLRSIEQLTKQRIEVARVPTVADLRARRTELLRASLRETLLEGELEGCRVVVESLAAEFDPMDIAAAAVKLAREFTEGDEGGGAEEDIPEVALHRERPRSARDDARGRRGRDGGDRGRRRGGEWEREREPDDAEGRGSRARGLEGGGPRGRGSRSGTPGAEGRAGRAADRGPRPSHGSADEGKGGTGGKARPAAGPRGAPGAARGQPVDGDFERVFIGAGRDAGVRPADLVGAITGEAGIRGRQIGAIQIADGFSIVEVAREVADDVLDALRATKLKGRKVEVRRA